MELFVDDRVILERFDPAVRQGTRDLSAILSAASSSGSPSVESTHLLMALARIPNGVTGRSVRRLGLDPANWESGLSRAAVRVAPPPSLSVLSPLTLHATGHRALTAAADYSETNNLPAITEAALLLGALENLTEPVDALFKAAHLDKDRLCADLRLSLRTGPALDLFANAAADAIDMTRLSGPARALCALMRREAESLGYAKMDARHLLLAMLERERGPMRDGLLLQGIAPRKIEEAVMLSLRRGARKTRTSLQLLRSCMQPLLERIFRAAGELAGNEDAARATEPHVLRAFLATDTSARKFLDDEAVNIADLMASAASFEEQPGEDEMDIADVETVRQRLRQTLVGQNDAIEQILPYIQRMRFGFSTPNRPVGTFLFCGQSGSGKTEMAKALARAIYGSEDNLIFLEMGQFNSPESMNIFVGAPPGYVGYGEGKLTNGLRDKPRSVVLFDEIEKVAADEVHKLPGTTKVLDALLRFLDEGRIDDPAGPVRDGTQCIIVLTSNLGQESLSVLWEELEDDPGRRTKVRKAVREAFRRNKFRVEFLNRLDELIVFRKLAPEDYTEIARRLLERDLGRLREERQIDVRLRDTVIRAIGSYCSRLEEGARAAQRIAQQVVINPVIDHVVRYSLFPPTALTVDVAVDENGEGEPVGIVTGA
jgi:ATP-dependent Clp protease ATP-binding subunit ClpA